MKFSEWAWMWAETYKRGAVKDNTYFDSYERQLRLHLVPQFGAMELAEIKPIHIQAYFSSLRDQYSVETQHKLKVCLKSLFDAAIENDLISKNPVTKLLTLRSNVDLHEIVTFNANDYVTVWQFADQHPLGVSIMFLMETALIRSEMLGIRANEYDPDERTIFVRDAIVPVKVASTGKVQTVQRGLKTKYRKRVIPISKELNKKLCQIPRTIIVNGHEVKPTHLIYSPTGLPWQPNNWYHRVYRPFMSDLQHAYPSIPYLQPKELRHTRAALLQQRGCNLYDIQRLLGHKDLTMLSRRYLHTDVDTLRDHLLNE